MFRTALITLAILSLTAGCVGDGTLKGETTSLSYNGEQSGSHKETVDCDEDGRVSGSGSIEDGTVRVRVTDGGGEEIWSKEYDSSVDLDTESLSGASGTWTIEAERAGDDLAGDEFNGEYTFNLSC